MCTLQILGLLNFLPYFMVFVMAFFGFFYGREPVIRVALFLMGQSALTSFTSKFLLFVEPLVQIALLVALFSLRITLVPYPVIWLADIVLFVSEPLWQVLEALGVVHLSMTLSQEAADHIDDQPNLAKGYIITMSSVCYILMLWMIWNIFSVGSVFYIWAAVSVLVCVLLIHCLALSYEFGILSDASTVGACSLAFLYDVHQRSGSELSQTSPRMTSYKADQSYVYMFLQMFSEGSGEDTWSFFSTLASPWFIFTSLARVCCVLFAVSIGSQILNRLSELSEEKACSDEDNDLEDKELPLTYTMSRSPLLIKLVVLFVYTQFIVCHLHKAYHDDTSWLPWVQSWFPSGRWIQIGLLNVYYIHRLNSMENGDDTF